MPVGEGVMGTPNDERSMSRVRRDSTGLSTVTKRQGWLRPTEGARQATAMRRSSVPGGSGSLRKRRTSRRLRQ